MLIDVAIALIVMVLVRRGASLGFTASLVAPLCFLLATLAAILYYNYTHDLFWALIIGLAAPILMTRLLMMALKAVGLLSFDVPPSVLSTVCGALITVLWGMVFVLPIVALMLLMPPVVPGIAMMQKHMHNSLTYALVNPGLEKFLGDPAASAPVTASAEAGTPPAQRPSGLESLSQDPRIQEVLRDPVVSDAIARRNIAVLLGNEKFLGLVQDPEMVKKILGAYKQMQK